jgi:hypothetical protein
VIEQCDRHGLNVPEGYECTQCRIERQRLDALMLHHPDEPVREPMGGHPLMQGTGVGEPE